MPSEPAAALQGRQIALCGEVRCKISDRIWNRQRLRGKSRKFGISLNKFGYAVPGDAVLFLRRFFGSFVLAARLMVFAAVGFLVSAVGLLVSAVGLLVSAVGFLVSAIGFDVVSLMFGAVGLTVECGIGFL